MRIETLRLPAFGGFTNKVLRFAEHDHCLHLVHGPNEAGKSTILRALNNLLFGFPHQTPDAHFHAPKDLAVGATLRLDDGKVLELVRSKRRKNDLQDGNGQVVDQPELIRRLGGISQDLFSQMFGLDQDRLHRGAEGLLQADGNLGQALFAAASGIVNLRNILNELEARHDRLFRPRAGSTAIHQHVAELGRLSKRLRELSLRPDHWKKLHDERGTLQAREKMLQSDIFDLDTNMARLQRYQNALRHIDLREVLIQRLDEVASVPLLAEDFTEQRTRAQQTLANALGEQDKLVFRLGQIKEQLGGLVVNQAVLNAAPEVQRLHEQTAAHRKAMRDVRKLEADCIALRSVITDNLLSLGREPGQTPEGTRRITRQLQVELDSLSREHGALRADLASSVQAEEEARSALAGMQPRLDQTPAPPDTFALEAALAKAADMGNPARRIREAESETQTLTQRVARDLKTLGLWQGTPAELENLVLPLPETLERFADDLRTLREQLEADRGELSRLEKNRLEKVSALQRLELDGELPDTAVLASARNLRGRGWELIKHAWLEGRASPEQEGQFIATVPGTQSLAAAFEKSILDADDVADTLFGNASNVAQAMTLRREIGLLDQEIQAWRARVDQAGDALQAREAQWREIWLPLGIAPLSPREMQAWLGKVRNIRQHLADLQERTAAQAAMVADVHAMTEELGLALRRAGQSVPEGADYAANFSLARKTLAAFQQQQAEHRELQKRFRELGRSRDKAAKRREKAAKALESWNTQWAGVMQAMELAPETTPQVATAVALALTETAQAEMQLMGLQQRIQDIRDEYRIFSRQVLALSHLGAGGGPFEEHDGGEESGASTVAAEDMSSDALLGQVAHLHAQVLSEQENARQVAVLTKEQRQLEQQLHAVRGTIQDGETKLAELCAVSGCSRPEELPRIEAAARVKAQVLNDRNKVEERLLELAGGEKLEDFIAAAREHQPDELSAKLAHMGTEKGEIGAQRDGCLAELGRIRAELDALDGTSQAAEIHQQIQETRAQLQDDTREYVRLRLASQILATEIERYRESNQGPVLDAASRYFQTMTLGSFSGLLADYDEKGDPVIKAVRDEERRLDIHQLSEGTRDQLFLALRLGGLNRYLQSNTPIPFIADDILVNFDDQRSAATLQILSEIARSTQIIFFTHHPHLVDIARSCLSPDQVAVYDL